MRVETTPLSLGVAGWLHRVLAEGSGKPSPVFLSGLVLVIGIIVAIVGGWLISQYLDGRKERSTEKLAQAMKIAEANLISDQEKRRRAERGSAAL